MGLVLKEIPWQHQHPEGGQPVTAMRALKQADGQTWTGMNFSLKFASSLRNVKIWDVSFFPLL